MDEWSPQQRIDAAETQPENAGALVGHDRRSEIGEYLGAADWIVAEYWTLRRRRLAVKPICRRAVRLVGRLCSPKPRVPLIVVRPQRPGITIRVATSSSEIN